MAMTHGSTRREGGFLRPRTPAGLAALLLAIYVAMHVAVGGVVRIVGAVAGLSDAAGPIGATTYDDTRTGRFYTRDD